MNFITNSVRKQQIVQVAFVLFLISVMINPVEENQPPAIPGNIFISDTTVQVISVIPDDTIEVAEPTADTIIDTGINQTQTNTRKTRAPKSKPEENTGTFIVPTHVQAENLLDQGYSVKDIARELGLDKKEVRQLKRKQRKEEKAALAERKKENKRKKNSQ